MKLRVGINGFGRIGRLAFRAAFERHVEVVAVNDITPAATLAHLLKYDSVHGRFPADVSCEGNNLLVHGKPIPVYSEKEPSKLPWGDLGVNVVLESTGRFTNRHAAAGHLDAGATRVIVSAPCKEADLTVVMGINDRLLESSHRIISNASCTTNCLAPMVRVLHDTFGIEKGFMSTVHSYTNDQRILDAPHKDLRRARSAGVSMIPTTTGAAIAVGKVIPELNGKLDGMAVRVPTPDGSLVDFVAVLKRDATEATVNAAFRDAAAGSLKGILEYTEDPIVQSDIVGNPASCIFDAASTKLLEGRLVKVLGWYDNEWGYSMRCIDLMHRMAGLDDRHAAH